MKAENDPPVSDCLFEEYYTCYSEDFAECTTTEDGECEWKMNDEFSDCLTSKGAPEEEEKGPFVDEACQVTGCSSTVCTDKDAEPAMTTCEYKEEYACYKESYALCVPNSKGKCSWTMNDKLKTCLLNHEAKEDESSDVDGSSTTTSGSDLPNNTAKSSAAEMKLQMAVAMIMTIMHFLL